MQRLSEILKLPVIVERGPSLLLKRLGAQKSELFLGHVPT